MSGSPRSIFVYGTLQRGEEREPLWPRTPIRIEFASVSGTLYDLGPYPALSNGKDLVRGELWSFNEEDLPETLRVLDEIEGYDSANHSGWYLRQVIECCRQPMPAVNVYTYYFAAPQQLTEEQRIRPGPQGRVHWHRFRAPADQWSANA